MDKNTDGAKPLTDADLIKQQYDPESGIYTLLHKAECKGRELTEVKLNRFKGKHMDEFLAVKSDYERQKLMIITSAQIAPDEYGEFDAKDLSLIADIISDFL